MAGGKGKSHGGKAGPGGKAHAEGVKVQQSHSAKAGLQVSSAHPRHEKEPDLSSRDIRSLIIATICGRSSTLNTSLSRPAVAHENATDTAASEEATSKALSLLTRL